MLRKVLMSAVVLLAAINCNAQLTPEITSWKLNTSGATGYGGIQSNVQQVQYSTANVYVSATCIPGYDVGPWATLPATQVPVNENFVYKVTRTPVKNTGTLTTIGGGHIGVWSNGVSIFNAQDAYSYNNLNIWHRDAVYFEGPTFDSCLGHPSPFGEYHTHINPNCLYNDADSTHHSPIIGYSFDGFPVYGAYSYTDTNGTGAIKRMKSSYRLRAMVNRDTLPDGTVLTAAQYGPAVSATYPLGYFLEDYEYVAGLGDLDAHNGRLCRTPDYPGGTYAYFVTINSSLTGIFPYVIYGSYYGVVQAGNTGPMGGHNTVTETVTTYTTGTENVLSKDVTVKISPNPASEYVHVFINPVAANNFVMTLTDVSGKTVMSRTNIQPTISFALDVSALPAGVYILKVDNGSVQHSEQVVIKR